MAEFLRIARLRSDLCNSLKKKKNGVLTYRTLYTANINFLNIPSALHRLYLYFISERKGESVLLKGNAHFLFLLIPRISRFMSHVFSNNSKNANHRNISQAGTDYCNSKLSKNIQFEKSNTQLF